MPYFYIVVVLNEKLDHRDIVVGNWISSVRFFLISFIIQSDCCCNDDDPLYTRYGHVQAGLQACGGLGSNPRSCIRFTPRYKGEEWRWFYIHIGIIFSTWYNLVKISSLAGDPHPSERQKTVLGMAEPLQWWYHNLRRRRGRDFHGDCQENQQFADQQWNRCGRIWFEANNLVWLASWWHLTNKWCICEGGRAVLMMGTRCW